MRDKEIEGQRQTDRQTEGRQTDCESVYGLETEAENGEGGGGGKKLVWAHVFEYPYFAQSLAVL